MHTAWLLGNWSVASAEAAEADAPTAIAVTANAPPTKRVLLMPPLFSIVTLSRRAYAAAPFGARLLFQTTELTSVQRGLLRQLGVPEPGRITTCHRPRGPCRRVPTGWRVRNPQRSSSALGLTRTYLIEVLTARAAGHPALLLT